MKNKLILTFLLTLICFSYATAQVKLTQVERSATKWMIPSAYRVVPGIPDYHLKYISLAALMDSLSISSGGLTGGGTATRIAFWTGSTALGSDADLYWDNTNKRVGIGDTSPAYKLDSHHNSVSAAGTSVPVGRISATPTTDDTGIGLVIQNKRTAATDQGSFLALLNGSGNYASNTSNGWRLYNQMVSSTASEFLISSQTTTGTTWTERMYISSAGVPRFASLAATTAEQSVILSDPSGNMSDISGSANGDILKYNGTAWALGTDNNSGGTVTSLATNNGITGGTITTTGTIGLTGQALALHNLATNGLIARTASGAVSARTLTPGTGISITNGDGVSGNPTITNTGDSDATNEAYIGMTTATSSQVVLRGGYWLGSQFFYPTTGPNANATGITLNAGTNVTFSGGTTSTSSTSAASVTINASYQPSYGRMGSSDYTQNFAASTNTAFEFNGSATLVLSGGTGITPNISTDRIDITTGGNYEISYSTGFTATATGTVTFGLVIEGSINTISQRTLTVTSGDKVNAGGTFVLTLAAGDSVGINMNPGTTAQNSATVEDPSLVITKLF